MANGPPAALDEAQAKRNENWSKKAQQYHQNWTAADAEDQLYRELEAQILIEHVGAGPTKQLLDVCCGTGRNTLALAFFFASLDQEGQLAQRIVIVDDPMTSLDEHRALTTVQEMRRLLTRVSQIVVLSHSKSFLCALWEGADTQTDRKSVV